MTVMTFYIKYSNKMTILYPILCIIDIVGVICVYFICRKKMPRKFFVRIKFEKKGGGWENFEKRGGGVGEKGQGQIKRGGRGPPVTRYGL